MFKAEEARSLALITTIITFAHAEVGMTELRRLYEFLCTKLDQPPLLIDSDDLIRNPEAYIKRYCEEVGVPFTDDIMQWKAGQQKHVSISQRNSCLSSGGLVLWG